MATIKVMPRQPFVINVSRNGDVKKLTDLAGYWLNLAQIWYGEHFLILNPKPTIKFLCDYISLMENAYDVIMTSIFVQYF